METTMRADALLTVAPPAGEGQGSMLVSLLPMILIFVIFYFLLIAPARRRQKKHAEMLGSLRNGDKVVTSGGIHGTVVGVSDAVVQLRIADQVKIDVSKHAIAGPQSDEPA
jgi:preprotein translocase subunit YajC